LLVTEPVTQVELHPYLYQKDLIDYCQSRGIQVEAYSPLGQGIYNSQPSLLTDKAVRNANPSITHFIKILALAAKYTKTLAQILLRWSLQRGLAPIVRSQQQQHIKDNLGITDWQITEEDLKIMDGLNKNYRYMKGWVEDQWD
jgi:diketogulonate reductase-like aldo/keto reductase